MTMTNIDLTRLEEGRELLLDFEKLRKVAQSRQALLPVAVQNADSGEVLFIAYVNQTALDYTLQHGIAAFWSTSRDELWVKGATSGDTLQIVEIRVNCEQNSLLYRVKLLGRGVCHTKVDGQTRPGCYYRRIQEGQLDFIEPRDR
jgi:phosphoribosyl-AMP cyclohydrolase